MPWLPASRNLFDTPQVTFSFTDAILEGFGYQKLEKPVSVTKAKAKSGSSPYGFRAPETHVAKARARGTKEGVSMSLIVDTIFRRYIESPALGINLGAHDLGETLPLPKSAAAPLLELQSEGPDTRFNAYLAALNEAGWSMQALAEVLGVTRQAVSLRVKKAEIGDTSDLPPVPPRSPHTRARTNLSSDEVQSFSVRLDSGLHDLVRKRAKREGAGITAILVDGLEDYANGDLTIPGRDEQ